ncbi:MAG TPA: hypothetical protein DD713_05650 [Nitrospiraceae bacterium]|nr:hypothetical protein [Nitrospiraceae bacterium]
MIRHFIKTLLLFSGLITLGCSTPPIPPEVKLAEQQEHNLWKAEAYKYTPERYARYKDAVRKGRDDLIHEESKFSWFRNYRAVESEFKDILKDGNAILKEIQQAKDAKSRTTESQISIFENKISVLKELTSMINEGRLSRKDITMAEIILTEAKHLYEKGDYADAEKKIGDMTSYIKSAENALLPILIRYTDKNQIAKWKGWVEDTISESRTKGIYAVVVSKIERSLILYKNGVPFRIYRVGIGRNGSLYKLHAGDNATPEGRYHIVRKLPKSRYYRALLINYPNEEDKKIFNDSKRKGLIPSNTGIGGLIEIHGGGKDGMTYGCIAMENKHIEELYKIIATGTPVTIVGTMDYENRVSSTLKSL